ncbi:MAG TPA: DUF2786 domain-containing protein [Dongiaceae bacterium]|nr:DUF2786 domain-containing protein [Dongiaceae bacterium]
MPIREATIATPFSDAERKRFQGLLRLAAESPFAGERDNALAAATRLAERHGMSVEEAAGDAPTPPRRRPHSTWHRTWFAEYDPAEVGRYMHLTDFAIRVAKEQRDAALAEARSRGLDAAEEAARRRRAERRPRPNHSRLDPREHARILLTETSLRLRDIVDITGLDIYQVVGLKLRLRQAAA